MKYKDYKKAKKRKKKRKILLIVLAIALFLGIIIFGVFRLRDVEIVGNERYSEEEIKNIILSDQNSGNALYLYWKYRFTQPQDLPFVDKVEVSFISPGKLRMKVYEKGIVGYVQYLDTYMYFDKDGIVVYSSTARDEAVPEIKGLEFKEIALYEELPVKNKEVFRTILELTQLLAKKDLNPDEIYFSQELDISLQFAGVEAALGKDDYLEEKAAQLPELLSSLKNKSGILHMESYNPNTKTISFENRE